MVGGFLDGVTILLSSDLTALMGGRGTGKSIAIESLAFVPRPGPDRLLCNADDKAIVHGVLRSGPFVNSWSKPPPDGPVVHD